jgi:hypothetical protein
MQGRLNRQDYNMLVISLPPIRVVPVSMAEQPCPKLNSRHEQLDFLHYKNSGAPPLNAPIQNCHKLADRSILLGAP